MNPTKNITLLATLIAIVASVLVMPACSTTVESGGSIDTSVVSIRTSTNSRFIVSGDTPVELNYDIHVDALAGKPSAGKVTAFVRGNIQEGRGAASNAFGQLELNERTSADGYITLFDKQIRYRSGPAR